MARVSQHIGSIGRCLSRASTSPSPFASRAGLSRFVSSVPDPDKMPGSLRQADAPPAAKEALYIPETPSWSVHSALLVPQGMGASIKDQAITLEELQHIARLAGISLRHDQEGPMQRAVETGISADVLHKDISQLLSFVKAIDAVPTDGVPPMWSPLEAHTRLPMHDDVISPGSLLERSNQGIPATAVRHDQGSGQGA
eukprot:jgi/Mesvir1/12440/Mv00600-RA.1